MFNISHRNKGPEYTLDFISLGHAQPATCANRAPQNESCPPLPFPYKSITPEIKQKKLAFIYWLHFFLLLGAKTCTEIRLLDQNQGNNKAKSRGFSCWGAGFFPFPPPPPFFFLFFF